jgi:hypothetical protein
MHRETFIRLSVWYVAATKNVSENGTSGAYKRSGDRRARGQRNWARQVHH